MLFRSLLQCRTYILRLEEVKNSKALDCLNEVENGFYSINQIEGSVALQLNSLESQPKTKKEAIAYQFNQVKNFLEENKAKK